VIFWYIMCVCACDLRSEQLVTCPLVICLSQTSTRVNCIPNSSRHWYMLNHVHLFVIVIFGVYSWA